MLELPQCLRLDLADALARHRELQADFLERLVAIHADAKAHERGRVDAEVAKMINASGAPIDQANAKTIADYLKQNYWI